MTSYQHNPVVSCSPLLCCPPYGAVLIVSLRPSVSQSVRHMPQIFFFKIWKP